MMTKTKPVQSAPSPQVQPGEIIASFRHHPEQMAEHNGSKVKPSHPILGSIHKIPIEDSMGEVRLEFHLERNVDNATYYNARVGFLESNMQKFALDNTVHKESGKETVISIRMLEDRVPELLDALQDNMALFATGRDVDALRKDKLCTFEQYEKWRKEMPSLARDL